MNPDVALILFQYKRGDITPQQFISEMRQMNFSLPQIMQVIADANNPRIKEPVIPAPAGGEVPVETAAPAPSTAAPSMAAAQTAPAQAAPRPAPAPVDPYAGMTPAEVAVAKSQDASNRQFWTSMRGAPETPVGQRRPSYQTLAGMGARTQAVDPEKAAQAQAALDVALRRLPQPQAAAPTVAGQPVQYSPGMASERAEEGPRMPYGDTMPKDYHSDRAEEGPSYGHTVQTAINTAKRTAAPQMAAAQTAAGSEAAAPSDFLHTLIRGRFGEAAKGNPMDDRLTAFQEARDRSGEARASGGAVGGKDAALHKALEIIHHLIRSR